jgi:hypothetical protein
MKLSNINKMIQNTAFLMIVIALLMVFPSNTVAAKDPVQKVFETPEKAAEALIAACQNNDSNALLEIFGKDGEDIINSVDIEGTRKRRAEFYNSAKELMKIDKEDDNRAILVVGVKEWPFPVPLVKEEAGWRFDSAAGKAEVLFRIIGENEIGAIEACLAYPTVQREYALADRNGDGIVEYATKIASSPGKMDGLYWDKAPGREESPVGKFLAMAGVSPGNPKAKPSPFSGYYFKILTRQGADAPGGKYDYIINGHMVGGFALVAYPAEYEVSGIMTMIVNQSGIVYEKDLGSDTAGIVSRMIEFNPDKTWTPVNK